MDDTANSRATALEVARLVTDHKGEDTVVLDVTGIASFADYFVISTGRSSAHIAGLVRDLDLLLRDLDMRPRNRYKHQGEKGWLLLDCGNVIIHLMEKEQREFYDLERLWFRAARVAY